MAHMTEVDAATLGDRIREARERSGLTQGDLAQRISLDRTALSKIESGARRVTALELAAIAAELGVRMAVFFQDPIPALVSHRSNQGLDTADSKIDRDLAELAGEVEFVQSLAPGVLATRTALDENWKHPRNSSDAEQFAEQVRALLEFEPAEPVHALADRVAAVGLWAFSRDLGVDTADAGTVLLREGGVCLVNSHNKVGRRRLALAHELGHYLLRDEYTVDWRVTDGGAGLESRLDRFARALLLPASGLREMWDVKLKSHEPRERAIITASTFQVDMSTLARRVVELDLPGDAGDIREWRPIRSDFVEYGLLPEPQELAATTLPVQYQRAVLYLYRAEKIGADRALDLLKDTFGESDLPPLHQRSELDIWQFVS